MRRAMLEALLEARTHGKAVALLTPLNGGAQRLLDADGLELLALTDKELATQVREALAADRVVVVPSVQSQSELMIVPHNPPLKLIIVGAVHVAEYLNRFAQALGYAVTVIDPRSAFVRSERFAGAALSTEWPQQALAKLNLDCRTAIVLLTHDAKVDDPAIKIALQSAVFYLGALGSSKTQAQRLERLAAAGITAESLKMIKGPAGLKIGARTPAEIALSVLAEMTQVLRQIAPGR